MALIPVAVDTVPPLARILVLHAVDQKTRALRNHRFKRFGDEKLERAPSFVAVFNCQHVFAEPGKLHFVDLYAVTFILDEFQFRFVGELGANASDLMLRAQCNERREVHGDRHARYDGDVDGPLPVEYLVHSVEIAGPREVERIGN